MECKVPYHFVFKNVEQLSVFLLLYFYLVLICLSHVIIQALLATLFRNITKYVLGKGVLSKQPCSDCEGKFLQPPGWGAEGNMHSDGITIYINQMQGLAKCVAMNTHSVKSKGIWHNFMNHLVFVIFYFYWPKACFIWWLQTIIIIIIISILISCQNTTAVKCKLLCRGSPANL